MNNENKSLEDESRLKLQSENNTAERYIAFLDIMGFKDRVFRTNHSELLKQLTIFNKTISGCIRDSNIQLAQFSDSVVLFTKDAKPESLKDIANVACHIMRESIKLQIPMKGAIAQGEITCDLSKQLFFGQALIDAYLLEENIYYYGIIIHNTAESSVINLKGTTLFKDIKAPLKSGCISHYELSWYAEDLSNTTSLDETKEALKDIRQTVSDAPRKYIDNTLDVIAKYYNSKS